MHVQRERSIIIGAGVAGMACALRLINKGHEVIIMECNDYPGGKMTILGDKGFRFDAGPSLFTIPQLMEELFDDCKVKMEDYFAYRKMDITCKYHYNDGTVVNGYKDPEALSKELENKIGEPAKNTLKYLKFSKKNYENIADIFLTKSLHKLDTFVDKKVLKALLASPKAGIFSSMNEVNKRYFDKDKTVQLFNRYATYNGSNPYKAPGILTTIPHLEMGIGTFLPYGGMHAITESLFRLCSERGAQFQFNTPVESIKVIEGKAIGVFANGAFVPSDYIISNADVWNTYRKLLPYEKQPEHVLNQERSSSAIIFYWGINKTFDDLNLHNIFFSEDYDEEFNQIFEEKNISNDPTIYLNISSKYEKSDAPEGKENWFVMINAPCNEGQDWEQIIHKTKQNVLLKLSKALKTDISELIECEYTLDPLKIEQRTGSYKGSLYGTSSNNKFSAFLRHPNFSSEIENLYFCGGSVHPGGGIPLCLLSAKIVSEEFD